MRLAERDGEVSSLEHLLQQCSSGSGVTAVIGGGIGCGKTELMSTVAGRAVGSGYTVLSAVGSWAERHSAGSVLSQLLRYADVRLDGGGSPVGLLQSITETRTPSFEKGFGAQTLDASTTDALHQLCTAVLRLADDSPVLLCIDDIQFADDLTVHWLLHLLRRSRTARVAIVMTECTLSDAARPRLHAELLRQPTYRRLTLDLLSVAGVEQVLAAHLPAEAGRLAAACHEASGGNPLLVRALAEDNRYTGRESSVPEGGLHVGSAYADTVLSCLHRGRPVLLEAARALVILDHPSDAPRRVARLLDEDPATAERALRALDAAGLVTGGRLRHPVARRAVRESIGPSTRAELHRKVAELLYEEGEPATQVALHLVAMNSEPPPWTVPVLREAAERFLAANRAKDAHACATAALRLSHEASERVKFQALLASAAWVLNPSISARHLDGLAAALRSGQLPEGYALMLTKYLLWHGRFGEAVEAFERISARYEELGPAEAAEVRATRELLATAYPALIRRTGMESEPGGERIAPAPGEDMRIRAAGALAHVLGHGPHDGAVADAEAAMRNMRLTKHTQEWLACAIAALVVSGRVESAATWCEHWLAEARARNVPLWAAEFSSLRASVALRQGDLTRARRMAEASLQQVPGESWGVCIGGPLAHLVRAATETGDRQAAAQYLDVSVPEGLFETRFGLHYLHARGRYLLAAGRPQAALGDFMTCGDLMRRWGYDQPALVPWRSEAAHAYLQLSDERSARILARAQLELAGPLPTWGRAVSLRAVAASSPPGERLPLLSEAVDILEQVGDRLELAGALADLGRAYGQANKPSRMWPVFRMATQLAQDTGARPLLLALGTERDAAGRGAAARPSVDPAAAVESLSRAERRVASLAARGHTNREIAEQLTITMSTVEQHLTRVFRKLGVRARRELPAESVL